ncbi:phosphatase PAP2 family protein [Aridibaculum aurantiacum]|uniref:phosphatase PAP2 family protein n=1 Tax=Aridibaculum aurantiacum TaxID=2810307 RepID=UPI001A959718|nr:phosphatase PAP2 family protein [Aridibaculum aurantiacum]
MIKKVRHTVRSGISRAWAKVTLMSVEIIVILIAFFVSLFAFVFIARMIFWKEKDGFDNRISAYFNSLISDSTTDVMQFFTVFGNHDFLIPANLLLIVYFLFIRRHKWYSIKVPVISIGSLLIMSILKNLFGRQRPLAPLMKEAKGLSFPSGHAMMSMAFYGLIIYIIWENVKTPWLRITLVVLLLITIFMIGISRIYLNVHYASDVVAGFSLGLVWLVISIYMLNRMERISKKEIDLVVEQEVRS